MKPSDTPAYGSAQIGTTLPCDLPALATNGAATSMTYSKHQPWKGHWPPKVVDDSAPYGFPKGDLITNSGN
ncbi:hypothetical protein M8818_001196 [Zalaria obscura]|uniref:Uncharacterized protein n=1 Tax=Zalaria obscura TaxID=2024903 RepID=A0ACC3SMG8_9PEZI